MDIDYPLLLTWAVLISGAIWLFDVLVLKRHRDEDKSAPALVEYARSFFPGVALCAGDAQLSGRAVPDSFRIHGADP